MKSAHLDRIAARDGDCRPDRILNWYPPRQDPPDLILARQALDREQFADAERHLRRALDTSPDCAEVRTLMGLLHEQMGEHHAAYQCYRLALMLDRHDIVARDGLRRYCQRFGYDAENPAINPAAADPA
jgi:uncharacterized protein HemY